VQTTSAELLVRLLTRHQEELFRYIFSLLPHEEDAKDVLQETSVALYRKFAEYDPEKPFLAWAYGFAHLEVLKQRERNARSTRLWSLELVEHLARERAEHDDMLQSRLQALEHCLSDLSAADQALIRQRYQGRTRAAEMIQQFGKSRRTWFRELSRIRRLLLECINRRVAAASA
jgi:RNA polymerase sigma-70 factor (ECF subfamily)